MNHSLLAFGLPVFLLLIALEYLLARRIAGQGESYFQYDNTVLNLSVGIAERLLDLFVAGAFYSVYDHLHTHYALFRWPSNAFTWLALFLFTDFLWYWYHRLAHEVNLLWSVHVVHHQSEDFNFTVSARITVFQACVRTLFWSVLPVLGFPAPMITTMLLIHGIYPFFLHTRIIPRLGWLEYILVTPSHHRVHHASNPQYLDKNYGDVLIVWDKLFGTFAEEREKPVYGLTQPLRSRSFLWQHFHFALELLTAAQRTPGWRNRLRLLFGRPERVDSRIRAGLEKKWLRGRSSPAAAPTLRGYVNLQLGASLLALFFLYFLHDRTGWAEQVTTTLLVLLTLINCGAILEQRSWIFYLEYLRLLLVVGLAAYQLPSPLLWCGLGGLLAVSLWQFNALQRRYLRLVYGPSVPFSDF